MQLKTILALALICVVKTHVAQNITDVKHVYTRHSGPIYNDGKLNGYYVVAVSKKEVKGKEVFSYSVLDSEMNVKVTRSIEKEKDVKLTEVVYNGSHVCIQFMNLAGKGMEYTILDMEGAVTGNYAPVVSESEIKELKQGLRGYDFPQIPGSLQKLPLSGFVRYGISDADGRRVIMDAFDNNGKNLWKGESEIKAEKLYEAVHFSKAEQGLLFTVITTAENLRMKNKTSIVLVHNIQTGKRVTNLAGEIDNFTSNLHGVKYDEQKKEYILYGIYGEKNIDATNDYYRKGFYFQTMDVSGNITSKKLVNWESDVSKLLPEKAFRSSSVGGGFFLHDLITAPEGFVLVCERFAQQLNIGVGVTIGTPSSSSGPAASVELESHNIFVFKIKPDFSFEKGNILVKEEHSISQSYTFNYTGLQVFEIGYKMKQLELFDFLSCVVNAKGEYICRYQDVDKVKNKSTKLFVRKTSLPSVTTTSMDLLSESNAYVLLPGAGGELIIEAFSRKQNLIRFRKL